MLLACATRCVIIPSFTFFSQFYVSYLKWSSHFFLNPSFKVQLKLSPLSEVFSEPLQTTLRSPFLIPQHVTPTLAPGEILFCIII